VMDVVDVVVLEDVDVDVVVVVVEDVGGPVWIARTLRRRRSRRRPPRSRGRKSCAEVRAASAPDRPSSSR